MDVSKPKEVGWWVMWGRRGRSREAEGIEKVNLGRTEKIEYVYTGCND
jgi:hypothetical protein